jgi:5-methylcytosine-specific restriction endonuclease McrA
MIDEAVNFSEESRTTINDYLLKKKTEKDTPQWDAECFRGVRAEIKDFYKIKQDYICSYCAKRVQVRHSMVWDTEHIVSKERHPEFMFEPRNLCIACKDCNGYKDEAEVLSNAKRVKYPTKGQDFLIVHPHFDEYGEHIRILAKDIYVARSKKGGFTKRICQLDRFTYESVSWDKSIAEKPKILSAIDALLRLNPDQLKRATVKIEAEDNDQAVTVSINLKEDV